MCRQLISTLFTEYTRLLIYSMHCKLAYLKALNSGNCTFHSGFIFIPLEFEGEGYCNTSAPLPNHQRIGRGALLLIS